MKATVTTFAVFLAITFGTVCTRAVQVPVQRGEQPDVVLTGCVVQGSNSTVFIFDNAKKDPNSAVEKGNRYVLSSLIEDVDLRTHLNHAVRIVGQVDMKVSTMPVREPVGSDPQRPGEERTLPRLIAKSLTMVSNKCGIVPGNSAQ